VLGRHRLLILCLTGPGTRPRRAVGSPFHGNSLTSGVQVSRLAKGARGGRAGRNWSPSPAEACDSRRGEDRAHRKSRGGERGGGGPVGGEGARARGRHGRSA